MADPQAAIVSAAVSLEIDGLRCPRGPLSNGGYLQEVPLPDGRSVSLYLDSDSEAEVMVSAPGGVRAVAAELARWVLERRDLPAEELMAALDVRLQNFEGAVAAQIRSRA